jgi:hypothetical protein
MGGGVTGGVTVGGVTVGGVADAVTRSGAGVGSAGAVAGCDGAGVGVGTGSGVGVGCGVTTGCGVRIGFGLGFGVLGAETAPGFGLRVEGFAACFAGRPERCDDCGGTSTWRGICRTAIPLPPPVATSPRTGDPATPGTASCPSGVVPWRPRVRLSAPVPRDRDGGATTTEGTITKCNAGTAGGGRSTTKGDGTAARQRNTVRASEARSAQIAAVRTTFRAVSCSAQTDTMKPARDQSSAG